MAGTAPELIRGAAVRRLELPNWAMAASGQAKRHRSNSDQRAHWGRHGKSLPHGVHGSPQLEARPGVSCILLDRAAHSSDFGNTGVGADPNALPPASDFSSADQKPVGPVGTKPGLTSAIKQQDFPHRPAAGGLDAGEQLHAAGAGRRNRRGACGR